MVTILKELKEFVRPSPHSIYGPSSGDRWMNCPFSVEFSKDIVEETSSYAAEGTLAHTVCEDQFRKEFYEIAIPDKTLMEIAMLPDRGDEMIECAEDYVNFLQLWLQMESLGDILWYGLERGIPIFPELSCFGTADFIIVGTKGAAIIDYKYGKGRIVERGSVQLKLYALGLWKHLKNLPEDYEVNAVVFQPRVVPHIPKVDVYYSEDFIPFEKEVYAQIMETKKPKLEPCGGSHCFWCPAKRVKDPALKCPIIREKPLKLANERFDKFFSDMATQANISPEADRSRDEALFKILSLAPLIKRMAIDAEEELQYRIEQGEAIAGCSVIPVAGNRKWRLDDMNEMSDLIKSKFPGQVFVGTKTTERIISITDVEKIVGKGNVDTLVIKPIKKKLHVQDEKVQEILGQLSTYNKMITES